MIEFTFQMTFIFLFRNLFVYLKDSLLDEFKNLCSKY